MRRLHELNRTSEEWLAWLKQASFQDLDAYVGVAELLTHLSVAELVALSENEPVIEFLAREALPKAEDIKIRQGKMERPEAPIYALIGTEDEDDVNAIDDLEGSPLRTRKAETDSGYKAPENIEFLGILSQCIHAVPGAEVADVISELLDISWNLVKLSRINERYSVASFNTEFAETLKLTRGQYFALLVAKYNGRYFGGGKDPEAELQLVEKLLQRFGVPTNKPESEETINERLKKLKKPAQNLFKLSLPAMRLLVRADYVQEQRRASQQGDGIVAQGLVSIGLSNLPEEE